MFSTTLAVTDAYARVWQRAAEVISPRARQLHQALYWVALLVVSGGAVSIIMFFAKDLTALIDLATTIAFLSAPIYGYINYRAVTHPSVPVEARPPIWLRALAWFGLSALALFSLFFLVWRYVL